jgi:tetratricopeptide (TPR) repeat protein
MRAPDPDKVRLLIAAQVASPSRPLSVGYSVSVPGGQVVTNPVYHDVPGGDGEWAEFVGEAIVDPGRYLVRLAAVDATGRRGSVEHVAKAALVSAGGLEISDLVLWAETAGSTIRPAVDLEVEGEGIQALVELGGRDTSRLEEATVAFELADFADGPALVRVPAPVSEAGADGKRVARVGMVGGLLPPGEYTGRAEVSVNDKPVAVVARPFRVVLPPPGSTPSRAPLASVLVETRPFDRAELLGARPLLHFVDRVSALFPGEAPKEVKAAIEEARQGRPEAMLDRLGDGAANDARADFLRGVSHYARGDWQASLVALRSALGLNSELFPAAVYMGACYAANGHDLEAIGAWQTALIGETGSPTLYAVLGDALLRVKETDQAASILAEGAAAFPDDELLRRRLALAHALAGHRDEALPVLTALVDENPDDDEALLATLALLFEGFSRSTAGTAASGETEELVRYARAYVEGGGPNQEVVERWLRYLESHPGG